MSGHISVMLPEALEYLQLEPSGWWADLTVGGGGHTEALLQANGIRVQRPEGGPLPEDASLFEIVEDVERRIITDMLEKCNWNQTEAAEHFKVPLSTLNQKIRRLNIEIKKKTRG